jgi:tetratricopeptide (TPR) repeat protein
VAAPGGTDGISDFHDRALAHLLERGCSLSEQGRCSEALACFDRALELCPDDPEILFWAGQERMHLCDYGRAEQQLLRAWEKDRQLVGCVRLLSRLYLEHLHRPDKAETLIIQARALHPDNPGLLKAEADLRLSLHEAEHSCTLYERVLEIDPEDCEARDGLATAYNDLAFELHQQGRTEEAIFSLRRALNITPDWIGLHVNLGQLFWALGRHRMAEKEFSLAAEEDPQDPIAAFNLARFHRQSGDGEQALAWFQKTLDLDDDYPDARPELASLRYERGEYALAAALLEEEVGRDPTCSICHHNLGLALLQADRSEEALAHLERSLALDPTYHRAHYNLAVMLGTRGREQEALEHLEEAFRLNPDSTRSWLRLDQANLPSLVSHPRVIELLGPPAPDPAPDDGSGC